MPRISATTSTKTRDKVQKLADKNRISFSSQADQILTDFFDGKGRNMDTFLRSFGEYLLSKERAKKLHADLSCLDERSKQVFQKVTLDDIEEWRLKGQN